MRKTTHLPQISAERLACLVGVTAHDDEYHDCRLVFRLETQGGMALDLPLDKLLEAIRFLQAERVIPPLSQDWWGRAVS